MEIIALINTIIGIVFFVCYLYQVIYIPIGLFKHGKTYEKEEKHRFAVLICARNEEKVISDLINSINNQTYDRNLIRIFVMADNCTDNTASVARNAGATVYKRSDTEHIGKGYALEALISHISTEYPRNYFDGYFVFDADNVLDKNYISEMNKCYTGGNDIITSYRNSKNYGDNWISAGYGLWFLRESRYLNGARYAIKSSCGVSGTGFFFSKKTLDEMGNWKFHLLTEDIEFSVYNIIGGRKIAYCEKAVFYDEQPTSFRQSWNQRLRWSKGYLQVFAKYGGELLSGILRGSFSCYDITMSIMPAAALTFITLGINSVDAALRIITGKSLVPLLLSLCGCLSGTYLTLFAVGFIATLTEWKNIRATTSEKLGYAFTFPFFMMTYIPIAFAAIFAKAEWKPIVHKVKANLSEY